jgi:hypothetical protein
MIQPLGGASVRRICGGQVLPSAASAAKELLENAIDAGATRIAIAVRIDDVGAGTDTDAVGSATGRSLDLCVVDNGSGVPVGCRDRLCQKHATSKLGAFEDLGMGRVATLGFRGEALNAVCAMAGSVRVVTKCSEEEGEGGEEGKEGEKMERNVETEADAELLTFDQEGVLSARTALCSVCLGDLPPPPPPPEHVPSPVHPNDTAGESSVVVGTDPAAALPPRAAVGHRPRTATFGRPRRAEPDEDNDAHAHAHAHDQFANPLALSFGEGTVRSFLRMPGPEVVSSSSSSEEVPGSAPRLSPDALSPPATGTAVLVQDLFRQLPVRKQQMLRRWNRELGAIQVAVQAYAVACTDVALRLDVHTDRRRKGDGGGGKKGDAQSPRKRTSKVLVQTHAESTVDAGAPATRRRVAAIFGSKLTSQLVNVDHTFTVDEISQVAEEENVSDLSFRIFGCVSKWTHGRGAGDRQFIYVNHRYVCVCVCCVCVVCGVRVFPLSPPSFLPFPVFALTVVGTVSKPQDRSTGNA